MEYGLPCRLSCRRRTEQRCQGGRRLMRQKLVALAIGLGLTLGSAWGAHAAIHGEGIVAETRQPINFGITEAQPSDFADQAVQPSGFGEQAVQPSGFVI